MILGILLLLTGLTISAVAIYYSVLGLAAIFAAATIPIYIMGGTLEVAKLVCASWLKANWTRVPRFMKTYMMIAVVVLMVITSMGIFGFLSKAHTDQSIVSGDASAQLSLYDEKIKTQRDNIEVARKAIQQMDAQVDARLSRGDSESSAERAVQIRRQQATERTRLQKEIADAQKEIAKLNEQRAPIAAQNRKIEAEVGPIKYIAKLIYGDNLDANILEKAVTWVIILIVIVFDPLAVIMLLAAQMTFGWLREEKNKPKTEDNKPDAWPADAGKKPTEEEKKSEVWPFPEPVIKESIFPKLVITKEAKPHHPDTHPYLNQGFKYPKGMECVAPLVTQPEKTETQEELNVADEETLTADNSVVKIGEEENQKKKFMIKQQGEQIVLNKK